MTKQVQRRRGTATQHTSFTGAEGELSVNTTNKSVHVHDGVTTGGIEAARADMTNVSDADLNARLTGNTLSALTITSADINGGTIDGTVIGGASAAAVTGTTITGSGFVSTGNMTFGDNNKAIFGAGSDLQIYHDGLNSYIDDQGAGRIIMKGSDGVRIRSSTDEEMIVARSDGAVTLYYDNAAKLSTTSTGVDVTGTVTADGLTVSTSSAVTASFARDGSDGDAVQIFNGAAGTTKALGLGVSGTHGTINSQFGGVYIQPSGTTSAFFGTGGDISFYEDTGTTPKFFWDASAESLGIGTTSPDEKLEVYQGNIKLGTDTNTTSKLIFERAAANRAEIYVGSSYQFQIDVGGTERLRIDASGNLHLAYAQSGPSAVVRFGGTNGFAQIEGVGTTTTGGLVFKTLGGSLAERMRIDASGNVGVGTSSPRTKLDIEGSFALDGDSATLATTTQTAIATYSASSFKGGKVIITANDGTDTYITELLIANTASTATATEYGQIGTGTFAVAYDVDVSGGTVRILATAPNSTSTTFKVAKNLM